MNFSLGEWEALALKAVRGAGLSWGVAAEAGKASRWLARHGFDAGGLLLDELERAQWALPQMAQNRLFATGGLSALIAGPTLSDWGHLLSTDRLELKSVSNPVFLLPFVASISQRNQTVIALSTDKTTVYVEKSRCFTGEIPLENKADVKVTTLSKRPEMKARDVESRIELKGEILEALQGFAHKTYAPATEASRIAGAGAGLTDND